MKSNYNFDTVCFGGEDWWYKNRAHIDMQLIRRCARKGTTLYINSIVMQKPGLSKSKKSGSITFWQKLKRKAASIFKGLKPSGEGFWIYSPLTLPVHHIVWLRWLNELLLRTQVLIVMRILKIKNPVVWVACPAACDTAIKLKKNKLVYQRTDRFEEYPNVDKDIITRYDRDLKAEADLTLFVNQLLYDDESQRCKKALFLDHGVDFDFFADAENDGNVPADIKNISKPIVGFFGAIDEHTFDIEFTAKVIALLPGMNFVFVGQPTSDIGSMTANKNIYMLGQKDYAQIPHYGKYFDVAIMPWNQNDWIKHCNPIKTKEYLALGKPVVSTPFPELEKYLDVIYKAATPEEFAEKIRYALENDNEQLKVQRKNKVRTFSWDSKAENVFENLFFKQA